MDWILVLVFIAIPLCMVALDTAAGIRARNKPYVMLSMQEDDFVVLVPIWGNVKYLENVEYLSQYGSKVILCTTGDETEEFYVLLERLRAKYGFRIYRDVPLKNSRLEIASTSTQQRSTSGTIRDRVIRNALEAVTAKYVVPLDADSTTSESIALLAGELVHRGLDIASIRIVPRNQDSLLAKLQGFEYRLAMQLRFVCPWLVSGACHVAKTEVLRDIMRRHSLFFQGNDVETGLLAKTLGYNVGHIPFDVLTTVPDKIKPWFRQRLAWSGGEFRLFIMNPLFVLRHPFFWIYGGIITICAFPLRWIALFNFSAQLLAMILLYIALSMYIHSRKGGLLVLVMPIYTLFLTLIMIPLGVAWYFYMAYKDSNMGIIRPSRVNLPTLAAQG